MNISNTQVILTAYPNLYRNLREFGFECEDGWFDLIQQLSAEIVNAAEKEAILPNSEKYPSIIILKQKFGELRVSFEEPISDRFEELVGKASQQSVKICEQCGAPGQPKNGERGWVKTLCEQCRSKSVASKRVDHAGKLFG